MGSIVALLLILHATVMYASLALGYDTMLGAVRMFNVLSESNIPTWFSAIVLFACSAMLAVIAMVKRSQQDAFRWQWTALAALFVFLSMDEAAVFHETFQIAIRRGFAHTDNFYRLAGLVFPTILGVIVTLFAWRWMVSLPGPTRRLFVMAAVLVGLGGIGVDFVSDYLTVTEGAGRVTVTALHALEEGLEMSGVTVFMYALLTYLGNNVTPVTFRVSRN